MVDETRGNRTSSGAQRAVMSQCLWTPEADTRPFYGGQPSSVCNTCHGNRTILIYIWIGRRL